MATVLRRAPSLPVDEIMAEMRRTWRDRRLFENRGLIGCWQQILDTCNANMRDRVAWAEASSSFGLPDKTSPWPVIPALTGTGKTTMLEIMATHLPYGVGAIFAVERKETVNTLKERINTRAGWEIALAVHTDIRPRPSPQEIDSAQVVIATHAALRRKFQRDHLEKRLGIFAADSLGPVRFNQLERYQGELRPLFVVDECFPMIDFADLGKEDFWSLLSDLSDVIDEWDVIYPVLRYFQDLHEKLDGPGGPGKQVLYDTRNDLLGPDEHTRECMARFVGLNVRKLLDKSDFQASRAQRRYRLDDADRRLKEKADPSERRLSLQQQWYNRNIEDLTAVQQLSADTLLLYSPPGASGSARKSLLSSASCLFPDNSPPGVILDATAREKESYRLQGPERFWVLPQVGGARIYPDACLHPAHWYSLTGKRSSVESSPHTYGPLIASVVQQVPGLKGLVVCPKDGLEEARKHLPAGWELTYWGGYSGSNDFRDCAVVVLLSLPHRKPHHALLELYVTLGIHPGDKHKKNEEHRRNLKCGHLASEMIQVFNRARCREPIDEYGRCATTHLFFPLDSRDAEKLFGMIRAAFPGCSVKTWDTGLIGKKEKPTKRDLFEHWLRSLPVGRAPATASRGSIKLSPKQLKRFLADLKDPNSLLSLAAKEAKVAFHPGGRGRGKKAYFEREAG